MRKNIALTLVALVALTIALAAVGCGKKQEAPATESAPPTETSTMSAESTMAESSMADTSMHQ